MLEQHGLTCSSRLTRQSRTCRVETSQVEFGPIRLQFPSSRPSNPLPNRESNGARAGRV